MRDLLLTRRRLLFTAGAGVLGVTVLNTVTGCTDTPGSTASASPAGPPASAGSSGAPTSAGPTGSSAAGPSADPALADWRRVNLSFVSAYLLIRGGEAAVVDLGVAGSADAIGAALTAAGSNWTAVRHVILTHQHADHAGGLAGVAPLVKAAVYAGQADLAAITSPTPLQPVQDGDQVFGLRIIGTPGHTAGHISVFDPSTGTLVAGDALRTTDGLAGADPQYTADAAGAAASVRKLAQLDIKTILPGHGDPLTTGAADALRKLAASLPTA